MFLSCLIRPPALSPVLPPDLLSGHRQRFNKLFTALKQFYAKSANLQYFKTLIQVPQLPDVSDVVITGYQVRNAFSS